MIAHLKAIPGLYMCFDSNHLLGEANPDFLRRLYEAGLAGRIGSVHISDYDFTDERHELPGNGKTTAGHRRRTGAAGLRRSLPLRAARECGRPRGHYTCDGRRKPQPDSERKRLTNTARFAIMKQTRRGGKNTEK